MTEGVVLNGYYDLWVVTLSIAVAVLGSFAALDLAERVTATRGRARHAWLLGSTVAQGIGIWAMHYTGMLSFHLPVPTRYHWPIALVSFILALAGAFVGLFLATRPTLGWQRQAAGGVFVGSGIVGQHYTAMASLRAPAMHHYSPPLVALSVAFAVGFALVSLWLMFRFRDVRGAWRRRIASALLMGTAICAMHYTAMAAATFTSWPPAADFRHTVRVSSLGILAIGGVTASVLALALVSSAGDRLYRDRILLAATSERLRALSAGVSTAREDEGRRIARELHDELGAALTSLKWELERMRTGLAGPIDEAQRQRLRDELAALVALVDSTAAVVKRLATELRPSVLDDLGLLEAIEWQAEQFQQRTGIRTEWVCAPESVDLTNEQSTAMFRICQEALTNVLRHAGATHVEVNGFVEDDMFVMRVRDNGRGITPEEASGYRSLGILGMRERAALVGATIQIGTATPRGTEVTIRIPVGARDETRLLNTRSDQA